MSEKNLKKNISGGPGLGPQPAYVTEVPIPVKL